jgi:hypothetical protein
LGYPCAVKALGRLGRIQKPQGVAVSNRFKAPLRENGPNRPIVVETVLQDVFGINVLGLSESSVIVASNPDLWNG